jgi:molybdenum cofactor cytidylyltransferase
MGSNIMALILAAGSSKRMGQTKQLLDFDGSYLLEHVISGILSFPFSKVLAVIGHEAEQIKRLIQIDDKRFRWVLNPYYSLGQSYSLKEGIRERGNHSNMMVFLGDQPLISDETVRTVIEAGLAHSEKSETQPFLVQPTFQEIPGHPVFFGNVNQIDFSIMTGDQGAKNVIKTIKTRLILPLGDPGVLMDIDTSEEYKKALDIWSKGVF